MLIKMMRSNGVSGLCLKDANNDACCGPVRQQMLIVKGKQRLKLCATANESEEN